MAPTDPEPEMTESLQVWYSGTLQGVVSKEQAKQMIKSHVAKLDVEHLNADGRANSIIMTPQRG